MNLYVKRGEFGEFQKAKMEIENFDDWMTLITTLRLAKRMYRDKLHEMAFEENFLEEIEKAYTDHELQWVMQNDTHQQHNVNGK